MFLSGAEGVKLGGPPESPIRVPKTLSAFHPRTQRNALRRREAISRKPMPLAYAVRISAQVDFVIVLPTSR